MDRDCTLLVNSYDGGEELWEGFFTALKYQWPDFDMPIVLNTEAKKYSFPGLNIKTLSLYSNGKKVAWARRLIETLKCIDTEYILFFLDDFWLDGRVDTAFFKKCCQWMHDSPDVAVLSFQSTNGRNIRDGRFNRFERRPQKGEYRMNCQAALWRREKLISYLRPHENPWEWELYGSIRSRRYKEGIYTLIEGEKKVFSYDFLHGGVIHRGRWCKSVVVPLTELYKLNIDFSKRGFDDEWRMSPNKSQRNLLRGIKNRINIIRSLI